MEGLGLEQGRGGCRSFQALPFHGAAAADLVRRPLLRQTALKFINSSGSSTHGNLRPSSIFTSPSGEWRLGGFEVLSTVKDPSPVLYVRPDSRRKRQSPNEWQEP